MTRTLAVAIVTLGLLSGPSAYVQAQNGAATNANALELFNSRILPIFRSPEPSSCVQCHLSAVDLKDYILPSAEMTFVSLRDQGLIDPDNPSKSKVLTLIQMGEKDPDGAARLIHENTRQAEYDAFAAWIAACCADSDLRALPSTNSDDAARPPKPVELIRHARKSRVVDSFVRNVWSQRMRCFPCHTPHEIDSDDPKHQAAIKTQQEFRRNYSDEIVSRLDIFRETPEATLTYLIETSRGTPEGKRRLLDLQDPRNSLIVMKPMSKVPPKGPDGKFVEPENGEPLTHMGGLKLHPDDQTYKSFITWIQDYANVAGDRYETVDELPADNWYPTQLVVRMTDAPESWPVGVPVQLFVHGWDEDAGRWNPDAVGFTQGTVTPRRIINGALFLFSTVADKASLDSASLPRGRYAVRAYVDANRRLADDPTCMLGEEDFVGRVEIKRPRWRAGFRQAEKVSANELEGD